MSTAPLDHVIVAIAGAPFHAFVTPEDGVIRAGGFSVDAGGEGIDPGLASEQSELFVRLRRLDPALAARGVSGTPLTSGAVHDALTAYEAGEVAAIDALPVSQPESPFRGEVWRALREVPAGAPVTYTELAALAGRPSAVRAAASGCANNLIALIVPCHRIVRTDGGLGGYLFGTELKRRLLEHEAAHAPA